MSGDRIITGDTILIDPDISNGDATSGIFLVEINGERVIRRIECLGEKCRLYTSNPDYGDSVHKDLNIIGKIFSNVVRF
jgi:SOS-response transcriptional repressor LexA